MSHWRLLYDEPLNGAANMAADEAILRTVAAGDAPPTLRLYRWQPYTLSLGYGQRARDVDFTRVNALGWGVVRRATGGLAVLHADELTYSVTLPEAHPLAAGGIMDTYLRLSAALLAAIQSMGIPVIADPEGGDYIDKGPVCFEVPSKYEITVNGRKLIGSAQMRRHHGVLQHGSLPLHGDLGRICDALVYPSSVEREHAKDSVRARAITLQEAGVVDVEWWHVAHIMAKAFSNTLHVDLVEGELSHTELTLADQLYRETYSTPDWNLKR